MADGNYYLQVLKITESYLGPAAERFIRRQAEFHLNKKPEDINKEDVKKMRESVRVALGLLVNDKVIVDEAVHKFDGIV
jgi:hypothetical protein